MSVLAIVQVPPTGGGRLRPSYSTEVDQLIVESREARASVGGFWVGRLLVEIAGDERLVGLELLVPRHRWPRDDAVRWPEPGSAADVVFRNRPVVGMEVPVRLRIRANRFASVVELHLDDDDGPRPGSDQIVALSEDCVAVVCDGMLVRFVVRLPEDRSGGATPRGLASDLAAAGVAPADVWALILEGGTDAAAIPVLLDWLAHVDDRVALIAELRALREDDDPGFALMTARAVSVTAHDSLFGEIADLVRTRRLGRLRRWLVRDFLGRSTHTGVEELLRELLDDEDVSDVAKDALSKHGT
jgi:hypothetical protein